MLKKQSLIVMGRKTYEAARPHMRLERNTLRIILTKHPAKYADEAVLGMLEFSNESPKKMNYILPLSPEYSEQVNHLLPWNSLIAG